MTYEIQNKPKNIIIYNNSNTIILDNTPNPIYGPMGRKVTPTGSDSLKIQYSLAEKKPSHMDQLVARLHRELR